MKLRPTYFAAAMIFGFAAGNVSAIPPRDFVASKPVYVPDYSHASQPLPDGTFAWDAVSKSVDVTNGDAAARFTFNFTNTAKIMVIGLATNVATTTHFTTVTNTGFWTRLFWGNRSQIASLDTVTNIVTVTNALAPAAVTILNVHPSCGCTTAELPPVPWTIPPGSNGQIRLSVSLAGKMGTLFKHVTFTTDRGSKDLMLRINILPAPPMPEMTEAQRDAGIAAAKVDRQAVFRGDCASCHLKNVEGQYDQQLFDAVCAICHEAKNRATMVPDLHNLQVPTSEEFWRTWITTGKAGSLMPAFATSQGGPLSDMQIASLAAYLHRVNPSRVLPGTVK